MDGVLVNFVDRARMYHLFKEDGRLDWNSLNSLGELFWSDLDFTENGKELYIELVKFCKANNINYCILSQADNENTIKGKRQWIKDNLGLSSMHQHYVKNGYDKSRFANDHSVLIDDFYLNIRYFEARNGVGILYKNDPKEIIDILTKLVNGISLTEQMIRKKVIRDKQKVTKIVSDKPNYRIEYDSKGNPREVRMTHQELLNRKHGQKSGKMKRYSTEHTSQIRRLQSFKKRNMTGLSHYVDSKGHVKMPKHKAD